MSTARNVACPSRQALRVRWNGDHIMSQSNSSGTKLVLVNHSGLGRIRVDMEAFFDLSFSLAEDLEDLVAKWAPIASPNASREIGQRNSLSNK
jgi:hypothetical protein